MKFYHELVRAYEDVFPLSPLKLDWLRKIIDQNQAEEFLDIGCATGALCAAISKDIDVVHGLDLDEAMIAKAQKMWWDDKVTFMVGDMLALDEVLTARTYDLISCFGNTLVHVDGQSLSRVLKGVYDKLGNKGIFVGQIINYDYVLDKDIKTLPLIDHPSVRFERSYDWQDESALQFKTKLTIKATGAVYDNTITLYPIRQKPLEAQLLEAGFRQVTFYQDYKGNSVDGGHLPLIFVAKS